MLEDMNQLVYMEAIKSLEYLAILLNKQLKPKRMKQLITLLVDKFKDPKSQVIVAVHKALGTIQSSYCLSFNSFVEFLVVNNAGNNKNSRVKQLILERVEKFITDEGKSPDELEIVFKAIKDTLLKLGTKDT